MRHDLARVADTAAWLRPVKAIDNCGNELMVVRSLL